MSLFAACNKWALSIPEYLLLVFGFCFLFKNLFFKSLAILYIETSSLNIDAIMNKEVFHVMLKF